jgi:hypothetical protein
LNQFYKRFGVKIRAFKISKVTAKTFQKRFKKIAKTVFIIGALVPLVILSLSAAILSRHIVFGLSKPSVIP